MNSSPRFPAPVRRTFKVTIRLTASEIERVRIAAAKQGMKAGTWVHRVAVDAALKAA